MKIAIILLAFTSSVLCDKFDANEINTAQTQLILDTITELKALAKPTGWAFVDKFIGPVAAPVGVVNFLNDKLGKIADMMQAEGKRRAAEGLPLIKEIFDNVYNSVYLWGRKTALAVDFPLYTAKNSTDGKAALPKWAVTSAVIEWRCRLDQERRTVHPTECKDEAEGWKDWNAETTNVNNTLNELIPKLHDLKSEFWAHQHERMRDYIQKGVPQINDAIRAEPDVAKRAKYLCLLTEDLHLLNTVASSRPPVLQ